MKNKSLLLMSAITMSLSFLTGCNNNVKYKDFSKTINKTTLGEASINNISKYTAIGVGKLDKASPNKRYRLLTDKNDGEETTYEADLSNTLLGLTTEGVLEELSLTIQNGQSLNSAGFNVTFFQEIGDFVLFSILPMDVNDYISGVVGDDLIAYDRDKNECRITYKECVSYAIDQLVYPLKYAIHYYDSQTKDYRFIDTSYLIHKQSGKIFPFSSHSYCVDSKKCRNGEFLNPTVILDNDESKNPINNLIKYTGLECLAVDYFCDEYINKPRLSVNANNKLFFPHSTNGVKDFNNGFACITSSNYCPDLTKPNTFNDGNGIYFHTVVFDDSSSSLQVTEMIIRATYQDGGVAINGNSDLDIMSNEVDKFGNILCDYKGRQMVYNAFSKQFTRAEFNTDGFGFDPWTKQFYIRCMLTEDENAGRSGLMFYNEQFEEDYRFCIEGLPLDLFGVGFYILQDNSVDINDKTKLFIQDNIVYRLSLDENRHYQNDGFSKLFELPSPVFYYDKERIYYYHDSIIYAINVNTLEDSEFVSLKDYPFVESVFMTNIGLIRFEGMDNQLNTFVGYVYPDGTISFDISEFKVDSQTTTLSPIN